MARTKQTARKCARTGEHQPERSVLLQLMGLPAKGDASACTPAVDWIAVEDRLKSHPQEAKILDPPQLDTAPFGRGNKPLKHPIFLALANEATPITSGAWDAFVNAFDEPLKHPRSNVLSIVMQNPALMAANQSTTQILETLQRINPYLYSCGITTITERTQIFQLLGYPQSCDSPLPVHHHNNYRGSGYSVNWTDEFEDYLRAHPQEAKITCSPAAASANSRNHGGGSVKLFPLEAALQFRYPPVPLSTVELLLELCPEAATIEDSCALSMACCFSPHLYPHSDPEVIRTILRANPTMASIPGASCCHYSYEEQMGLPLHTLMYFMPDAPTSLVSELIQSYPQALASTEGNVYGYIPLRVACERTDLSTAVLRVLLEEGHRQGVGIIPPQSSPSYGRRGQMFFKSPDADEDDTPLSHLTFRALMDRDSWEQDLESVAFDNLCLGLKAAGAQQTQQSVEELWNYPLLHAVLEFGTVPSFVMKILQRHLTSSHNDLIATDGWGRTPLDILIDRMTMYSSSSSSSQNGAITVEWEDDEMSLLDILKILLGDDNSAQSFCSQPSKIRFRDDSIGGGVQQDVVWRSLPLHRALHRGMTLQSGLGLIVDAYPKAVGIRDSHTKLIPCLLAASTTNADLDTIFQLIRMRQDLIVDLILKS